MGVKICTKQQTQVAFINSRREVSQGIALWHIRMRHR